MNRKPITWLTVPLIQFTFYLKRTCYFKTWSWMSLLLSIGLIILLRKEPWITPAPVARSWYVPLYLNYVQQAHWVRYGYRSTWVRC